MRRTTIRLDDSLLEQARREAEQRGETVTSLIEKGLRLVLSRRQQTEPKSKVELIVSKAGGGLLPGIDLDDSAGLLDLLESPSEFGKR